MSTTADEVILLTVEDVAKLLNVPLGTVRNNACKLPRRRVGRRILYVRDEIARGVRECPEEMDIFAFFAKRRFGNR